ncbi:MAG: hypothetical protein WC319_00855 [Candidatus Paceibacterota bacterium]
MEEDQDEEICECGGECEEENEEMMGEYDSDDMSDDDIDEDDDDIDEVEEDDDDIDEDDDDIDEDDDDMSPEE